MRRVSWWLVLVILTICVFATRPARANGRFPASNSVMFDPHDPQTIYVRVTFGLLVSHDAGQTWHWICERAIGFSGIEDPTYVVTPTGALVGGTFSGIAVTRDGGCNWSFADNAGKLLVSDIALRADGSIVAITSTYSKAAPDGGLLYDNRVLASKDDAKSFSNSGAPLDPTMLLESIEVAQSDNARLYISAVRGLKETRTAAFLTSLNDGMSWNETKIELLPGETAAFIANVDPKNADRVYVRTSGAPEAKTRLLVSDDAGKTWKTVFNALSPLLGFALADDGKEVWVGSREGVSFAPTDTFKFTKGSSTENQCLGLKGTAVWACSTERNGFFVGESHSEGRSFDARVHLDEIKGPLECPAESSVGKICALDWVRQRRELGLPDPGEKTKGVNPGGPALRGREERKTFAPKLTLAGAVFLACSGYLAYQVLKILKRRRGG